MEWFLITFFYFAYQIAFHKIDGSLNFFCKQFNNLLVNNIRLDSKAASFRLCTPLYVLEALSCSLMLLLQSKDMHVIKQIKL